MQFRLSTLLLLFVVLWSSLAVFGAFWGVVIFVLAVGWAVYVSQFREPLSPAAQVIAIVLGLFLLIYSLVPQVGSRPPASRVICNGNLKQIALALHNYHAMCGCFPPAYIADKSGRRMHSWRMLILPLLECKSAFDQYDFNEPWDGPNNRRLLADCPPVYRCPADSQSHRSDSIQTSYVAVVGPNSAWSGERPRTFAELAPPSETIMVAEVIDAGIGWTEPRDLLVPAIEAAGDSRSTLTISSQHGNPSGFFYTYSHGFGANVAMADGSVLWFWPECLPHDAFRKCLRVGGCNESTLDMGSGPVCPPKQDPLLNRANCAALAVWLLSVALLFLRANQARKNRVVAAGAGQGSADGDEGVANSSA
jgi:prepilin-type processing-associated H-X9-DG protein